MSEKGNITRREFLQVSAVAAAGAVAAACAGPTTAPAATATEAPAVAPTATRVPPTKPPEKADTPTPAPAPSQYSEAPLLATKVEAGDLPPVDERVPTDPFVIDGLDGIGNFGGAMRKSFSGMADYGTLAHMNYRGILNINHEYALHIYMGEAWEVSEDGREFTITLRKGLKWSDGEEMTSEDCRFWYEDEILNRDLTPTHPEYLASTVEGERVPAEFSVLDDYTVKFTFVNPNPLLHYRYVLGIPATPAHYMKQFHQGYADAGELAQKVSAGNYDDWTALYFDSQRYHINVECPIHMPWAPLNPWSDEFVVAERNPYFWEVDTAGNQLPYLDHATFRVFSDVQVAIMWAANGEIDCQTRHIGGFENFTTFKKNEAQGDYTVQEWIRSMVHGAFFNMTCKDERLRKLFSERDFRIAMSHAVDRDAIREMLFEGTGVNKQYTPPDLSGFGYPKLANAYLEYDPDKANELIDGLGYTERDAEGYRLWPGTNEIIQWTTTGGAPQMDAELSMLADFWKDTGFKINYRGMDRALSIELHNNNEAECDAPATMDYNLVPLAEPRMWVRGWTTKPWAVAWQAYYDNPDGPISEKPPDGHWIWDIWENWANCQKEPDEEKRKQYFFNILDIWAEELPAVGFFGDLSIVVIVKNGLKGIHAGYYFDCCSTIYEYVIDDATWYWDEPDKHKYEGAA